MTLHCTRFAAASILWLLGTLTTIRCSTCIAGGKCLTALSNSATWNGAQSACRALGGRLPVADTVDMQNQLITMAGGLGLNRVWLGANETNDSVWSWTNGKSYNTTQVGNPQISGVGLPTDYRSETTLMYTARTSTGAVLTAHNPTEQHLFICVTPNLNTGTRQFSISIANSTSWFTARMTCSADGISDIAQFDITPINSFYPFPALNTEYWIGLRQRRWIWQDYGAVGAEVKNTYWLAGEPQGVSQQRCLSLENKSGTWGWTAGSCTPNSTDLASVICETNGTYVESTAGPITSPPTNKPSTSGTVDPCTSYTVNDDSWRSPSFEEPSYWPSECDDILDETQWIRFVSSIGNQLADNCPAPYHCGTDTPMWMQDTHPTALFPGPKSAKVCYNAVNGCCVTSETVLVKWCPGVSGKSFYVYLLKKAQGCSAAYCVANATQCPSGQIWNPVVMNCIAAPTAETTTSTTAVTVVDTIVYTSTTQKTGRNEHAETDTAIDVTTPSNIDLSYIPRSED